MRQGRPGMDNLPRSVWIRRAVRKLDPQLCDECGKVDDWPHHSLGATLDELLFGIPIRRPANDQDLAIEALNGARGMLHYFGDAVRVRPRPSESLWRERLT